MVLVMRCLAALASFGAPLFAYGHAFEERYDLPAPLAYFTTGAAAVVILSFVIAQIVVEHSNDGETPGSRRIVLGWAMPLVHVMCRLLGLFAFGMAVFAGLKG